MTPINNTYLIERLTVIQKQGITQSKRGNEKAIKRINNEVDLIYKALKSNHKAYTEKFRPDQMQPLGFEGWLQVVCDNANRERRARSRSNQDCYYSRENPKLKVGPQD